MSRAVARCRPSKVLQPPRRRWGVQKLPWASQLSSILPRLALIAALGAMAAAQAPPPNATWAPPGGTAASLLADPAQAGVVELGTTTGVVFQSRDNGAHWRLQAHVVAHDDWVVASLVATPRGERIYAGMWSWSAPDGGIAVSGDGGATWRTLFTGHAVRALAIAPTDANIVVAATLDGVYRSRDAGMHWELISPAGNRELSRVESVAIDPVNPDEIYVGTWHLPWKTFDGGHDWIRIDHGIVDDSDVFAIDLDPRRPGTLYLSACSGIYHSDDSGQQFQKLKGIPDDSRRTTALVQDPANPNTIYAGTTTGLWISRDAGATWTRRTPANISVNAVLPLAAGRVLLATDHAGVLASSDGETFAPSNDGFVNRHLAAVAAAEGRLYEAVTGDGPWGGIFVSARDGADWKPLPPLPGAADAVALYAAPGAMLAASAAGVFRFEAGSGWRVGAGLAHTAVFQLAGGGAGEPVFAATSSGLFVSRDSGVTWKPLPLAPAHLYRVLQAGPLLYIAGVGTEGRNFVLRSRDGGEHFLPGSLYMPARINQLAATDSGAVVFASTSRGLYRSSDAGATWQLSGHGMGQQAIAAVFPLGRELWAAGAEQAYFVSSDEGRSWRPARLEPAQQGWMRALAAQPVPGGSAPMISPPPRAPGSAPQRRGN